MTFVDCLIFAHEEAKRRHPCPCRGVFLAVRKLVAQVPPVFFITAELVQELLKGGGKIKKRENTCSLQVLGAARYIKRGGWGDFFAREDSEKRDQRYVLSLSGEQSTVKRLS
mmetsp:Transcript_5820/g.11543  ORF Transcript_5820/g.11543 Transcript_5820/m.11543 type:complete len:112 (+) Transcript_5820:902-1237(+)